LGFLLDGSNKFACSLQSPGGLSLADLIATVIGGVPQLEVTQQDITKPLWIEFASVDETANKLSLYEVMCPLLMAGRSQAEL